MKIRKIFVFIMLVLLLLLIGKYIPFVKNLWVEDSEVCEIVFENMTLKGVSGIEDIDTGLLSGGSVYRKDLLFENGMVLQLKTYDLPDLILGRQYTYEKCEFEGGFMGIMGRTELRVYLVE